MIHLEASGTESGTAVPLAEAVDCTAFSARLPGRITGCDAGSIGVQDGEAMT